MSNGIELKIKHVKTDYMHELYLGIRGYFIELSKSGGYSDNITKVAAAASAFPLVVLNGDEPLEQMTAVAGLCKEIQKMNPYTKIIVYTGGSLKPVGMTSIKNIDYIVKIKPKDINFELKERIDEVALKWLAKAEAKFMFEVKSEDDYDEINLLMAGFLIKKSLVFIDIKSDDFQNMAFIAFNNGYNILIKFEDDWFKQQLFLDDEEKDAEAEEDSEDEDFEKDD